MSDMIDITESIEIVIQILKLSHVKPLLELMVYYEYL